MKNSTESNMYNISAQEVLAAYAPLLQGTGNETLLAISTHPLDDTCRGALVKSAVALGYGEGSVAFAITHGQLDTMAVDAGFRDVYSIVEGLDPLAIVAADRAVSALLGEAYRCEVPLDNHCRVMGRTVVAFASLPELMAQPATDTQPAGKQVVWNLLKALKLSQ